MLKLVDNLRKYAEYLREQRDKVSDNHVKRMFQQTDVDELQVLNATLVLKAKDAAQYRGLHAALKDTQDFQPLLLREFCPGGKAWQRHEFKRDLVVPVKSVLYTYSGTKEHFSFLWKIPASMTETDLQKNVAVQQQIKAELPKFQSHAMRQEFVNSFGTVTHAKPAILMEA